MKKIFVLLFGLILLGSPLFFGCGDTLKNPPVGITFRKSMMFAGYVAQVTNLSNETIMVSLYVKNDKHNQREKWSFPISRGETKEIGVLETSWHFDPGEEGYVEVQGYRRKLYYEVGQGNWRTSFGF